MKKIFILGILVFIIAIVDGILLFNFLSKVSYINCQSDYNCLYDQIVIGNSAKMIINEENQGLGLIENSEIKAEPNSNGFIISFKVLDLQQVDKVTKSQIKSTFSGLDKAGLTNVSAEFAVHYKKFITKEAVCQTKTALQAKELVLDGLTNDNIDNYSCTGSLVQAIKEVNKIIASEGIYNNTLPSNSWLVKKPAVYLYPGKDSEISVSIKVNGQITKSIPDYNNGWLVKATPEGLIDDQYDYLFYEADLLKIELPKKGWLVKYEELEKWFNDNLSLMGLNNKEISQFNQYWLNELEPTNYYKIKLLSNEFLKNNMDLVIEPQPESLLRLNFVFTPLLKYEELEKPNIEEFHRDGFTVVEWGGVIY